MKGSYDMSPSAKSTKLAYGNAVTIPLAFEDAVKRTREALQKEGFGVLCEIDVAKTLREKIDVDSRPYTILGACNPQLAHRALTAENDLGLLLPCNVVVSSQANGTRIATIDAAAMMGMVGNAELESIAAEVNERLACVLEIVAEAHE